jgi:hypothetical protein
MTEQTIVLVDKYGELWTLDYVFTQYGMECGIGDGTVFVHSPNPFGFITLLGMELLGEL